MKVRVNGDRCNSYGVCLATCAEVFDLDENDIAYVVSRFADGVPDELEAAVKMAVLSCPQQAIEVIAT